MSLFSIKDIEQLTGIKAHTLRAWEQRYNLPRPKRTAGNVRYYDDEDLKLLLNVAMLSQHGHRISEITRMNQDEIGRMAIELSLRSTQKSVHIQALVTAMLDLDEQGFKKALSYCFQHYGVERTVMDVIFPVMTTVGTLWQAGTLDPSFEHFMSSLIRQKLIVAIDELQVSHDADVKKFLLFLPEGEFHELGLLFANYIVRSNGHHSVYLGQNLPVSDLDTIAERYKPDYVFTSLTTGFSHPAGAAIIRQILDRFPNSRLLLSGKFFLENKNGLMDELGSRIQFIYTPEDFHGLF